MKTSELIEKLNNYRNLDLDVVINNYDDIESVRLSPNNKISLNIENPSDYFIRRRLLGVYNYLKKIAPNGERIDSDFILENLKEILEDM